MPDDLEPQRPVIVTMPKEIDAGNANAVRDMLDAALAQGAMAVVVDCTATIFCDSVGFNTLLLANQKARAAKAELLFAIAPDAHLRRVLKLLEMQDTLAVYPSIDAAVTASRQLPLTRTAATILSRRNACGQLTQRL
jgi:anti-anti-sigma factor